MRIMRNITKIKKRRRYRVLKKYFRTYGFVLSRAVFVKFSALLDVIGFFGVKKILYIFVLNWTV